MHVMFYTSRSWILALFTVLALAEAGSPPSYESPFRLEQTHDASNQFKRQHASPRPPCAPADAPKKLPEAKGDGPAPKCLPFLEQDLSPVRERSLLGSLFRSRTTAAMQAHVLGERFDNNDTVKKRAYGEVNALYNQLAPNGKVPVDNARIHYWQNTIGTIDFSSTAGIGVSNLCGGSVAIVSSMFATIMVNIPDQRAAGGRYVTEPESKQQIEADARFVRVGVARVKAVLESLAGTATAEASNDWNSWFAPAFTTVVIIAPQWDLEAMSNAYPPRILTDAMLDVYEKDDFKGQPFYIYPWQPSALATALEELLRGPGKPELKAVAIYPYRKRMEPSGIPKDQDDRKAIVVVPRDVGGRTQAVLYFDEDKVTHLNPLA